MGNLSKQTIKGYELREVIGTGGFGAVYRAFQPVVDREVAIKVILPQFANQPDFIRRFDMEAQLVARLEHMNIVPLYDYWRDPDGAYLVMRYLRGGSLRERLKLCPLSLAETARVVEQIGAALTVAHRNGVIHRDLKPANILLDEEGNAYLTDFGIAKALVQGEEQSLDGHIIGSPAYLSPEQIRADQVTPATDIYALGLMIYEVLTGQHPFPPDLNPTALMYKHLTEPVPSLNAMRSNFPPALDEIIQRATAKHPNDRYPDAMSITAAFRKITAVSAEIIPIRSTTRLLPLVLDNTAMSGEETTPISMTPLTAQNPYKGLRAFQQVDAPDFFGREALTQHLIERLAEPHPMARFLAVVGPSGSGKSSVVRAGLIPALRAGAVFGSECWFVAEMLPGARPLDELEVALLRVADKQSSNLMEQLQRDEYGLARAAKLVLPENGQLILVVDQFEEIFMLSDNADQARHFLNLIHAAVMDHHSQIRVIVTLRADFYDRPLLIPGFSELMRQRTEAITPLTPAELEQAIVQPVQRINMSIEQKLISSIISEVSEQPGALPMLQYALTELFERRSNYMLTSSAYRDLGGVMGVLAKRAEEVFNGLDNEQQDAARQLFLRLVTLGEGTEDTRRRVKQIELLSLHKQIMPSVIEAFGKARLLTFDHDPQTREPTVEVAHEALIREWKQLRVWLDESRDDMRLERLLAAAADEWRSADHDPGFLLYGSRLAHFDEWTEGTRVALTESECAFLEASIAQRELQAEQESERQAREKRLERRSQHILRVLVGVLLIAALGTTILSLLAFDREKDAKNAQTKADRSAAEAHSLALAASARAVFGEGATGLAMALALEANQIESPPIQVQQTLADMAYVPGIIAPSFMGHPDSTVESLAITPDGTKILSGSDDGTLAVWDISTGQELLWIEEHTGWVTSVAISPDGRTALSGSGDETVRLWDLTTGAELRRFVGHTGTVWSVAFSPDGQFAVSGGRDTTIRVWDIATGLEVRQFVGASDNVTGLAFSPDGQMLASVASENNRDKVVRLWNFATGEPIGTLEGHSEGIKSVAFSPDGNYLVTASMDNSVRVWDVNTGETIQIFDHQDDATYACFDPSGQQVLSASLDQTVRLWDITTGDEIQRFEGQNAGVLSLAISPSAPFAVTGGDNGSILLWKFDSGMEFRRFSGHTKRIWQVALSPTGEQILSASGDRTVRLWDLATGIQLHSFEGHTSGITSVAFDPQQPRFVSGSMDGTLRLWSLQDYSQISSWDNHTSPVWSVAFSPDGHIVASASEDGIVRLWDVTTGAELRQLVGHTSTVWSVAFSPDGRIVASASEDGTIRLWDVTTGAELRQLVGHTGPVNAIAFSPDDQSLLSGSDDQTVRLWDIDTGAIRFVLNGHSDEVNTVAFSPDGQAALSGAGGENRDTDLILWDISTGTLIRRIAGHDGGLWSVVFTPDGQRAVSGSYDQTVRLWHVLVGLDDLMEWMQTYRTVPPLTCEQREQYQIKPYCD